MSIESHYFRRRHRRLAIRGVQTSYSMQNCLFYYDASRLPESSSQPRAFDESETLLHELTHWYQHHGTTIGTFLSLLKHVTRSRVEMGLRALPDAKREKLLRRRAEGTPIFAIDPATHEPSFDDDWMIMGSTPAKESFYSASLAHAIWSHYSFVLRHTDPAAAMLDSLVSVDMLGHELFTDRSPVAWEPSTGTDLHRRLFEQFKPVTLNSSDATTVIDTEDLFEAAALLTEFGLILGQYDASMNEAIGRTERVQGLRASAALGRLHGLDDTYVAPIKAAVLVLQEPLVAVLTPQGRISVPFIERWTSSLVAAIDIALNPPLPPRVPFDPAQASWEAIYPPARYLRCLHALKRMTPIQGIPDLTTLRAFAQELALVAGVPYSDHSRCACRDPHIRRLIQANHASAKPDQMGGLGFEAYMIEHYARVQHAHGAATLMALYVNAASADHVRFCDAYEHEASAVSPLGPPVMVTPEGVRYLAEPKQLCERVLIGAAVDSVCDELFVGVREPEIDLAGSPLEAELLERARTYWSLELDVAELW